MFFSDLEIRGKILNLHYSYIIKHCIFVENTFRNLNLSGKLQIFKIFITELIQIKFKTRLGWLNFLSYVRVAPYGVSANP